MRRLFGRRLTCECKLSPNGTAEAKTASYAGATRMSRIGIFIKAGLACKTESC